ncbi:hypothetical protein DV515_00010026, partial [Chloebia gouldiae]
RSCTLAWLMEEPKVPPTPSQEKHHKNKAKPIQGATELQPSLSPQPQLLTLPFLCHELLHRHTRGQSRAGISVSNTWDPQGMEALPRIILTFNISGSRTSVKWFLLFFGVMSLCNKLVQTEAIHVLKERKVELQRKFLPCWRTLGAVPGLRNLSWLPWEQGADADALRVCTNEKSKPVALSTGEVHDDKQSPQRMSPKSVLG